MSFLKDMMGGIFGSAGGEMDWEGLMRVMEMEQMYNRTDRHGAFSDWDWAEDPETGRWTQSQTLKPEMQQGADRLLARAGQGQGFENYQSPDQFSTMLDSAMANQMQRQGTLDPNYQVPQQEFGTRAGDREGRFAQAYIPPPPPDEMGPQQQQQQPQPQWTPPQNATLRNG
jgi:hypothetical protein